MYVCKLRPARPAACGEVLLRLFSLIRAFYLFCSFSSLVWSLLLVPHFLFVCFVSGNICTFQHSVFIDLAADYVLTSYFYLSGFQKLFCSLVTDFLNMDLEFWHFGLKILNVCDITYLCMCYLFCRLMYQKWNCTLNCLEWFTVYYYVGQKETILFFLFIFYVRELLMMIPLCERPICAKMHLYAYKILLLWTPLKTSYGPGPWFENPRRIVNQNE